MSGFHNAVPPAAVGSPMNCHAPTTACPGTSFAQITCVVAPGGGGGGIGGVPFVVKLHTGPFEIRPAIVFVAMRQ